MSVRPTILVGLALASSMLAGAASAEQRVSPSTDVRLTEHADEARPATDQATAPAPPSADAPVQPPSRPAAAPPSRSLPTRSPPHGRTGPRASRSSAAPGESGTASSARRGGAALTSPTLDPEQLESLIGVAEDISPEWAEWLRARRESDPEALRSAVQSQGRRLIALAVLREHSPDLYELKVSELRLQSLVGDLARRYREAVEAGRAAESETLLRELRAKATEQVDKSLKSRAAELAELDQQVRQLKERLLEDSRNREDRIEELLKSVTQPGRGEPMPQPPTAPTPSEGKPSTQPEPASPTEAGRPDAGRRAAPNAGGSSGTTDDRGRETESK